MQNASEALEMAETGLRLAALIPTRHFGTQAYHLSVSKAWGTLGGTLREVSRYEEALFAYKVAFKHLRWGNAGKLDRAILCRRLASLFAFQGKYLDARRCIQQAMDWYRAERKPHLLGQAFADMGRILFDEGEELRIASEYFHKALKFISPEDEAYLLSVRYSLLLLSCHDPEYGGSSSDLLALAGELRNSSLYQEGSNIAAKILGLEGYAYQKAGRYAEAVSAFEAAKSEFFRLDDVFAASIVILDLASLWIQLDQPDRCRQLAGEMFPLFKALKLDRQATAALMLFINGATRGQLSRAVVEQVREQLQKRALAS